MAHSFSLGKFMLCLCALFMTGVIHAESPTLDAGKFSSASEGGALPSGWQPMILKKSKKPTVYTLVKDDGKVVVKAESEQSASGLAREISIDPKQYPILEWRWKIANVIDKADPREKQGEDFPARLYVHFDYDPAKLSFLERTTLKAASAFYGRELPTAVVNYVWEGHIAKDTLFHNPFSDRIRVLVVESGTAHLNQWRSERRNIFEDYRRAFGEDPPMITGVAIMTDSDNTGESATAWYGDIVFKQAK
jgi:Protein of unknown function (DUF3047)